MKGNKVSFISSCIQININGNKLPEQTGTDRNRQEQDIRKRVTPNNDPTTDKGKRGRLNRPGD